MATSETVIRLASQLEERGQVAEAIALLAAEAGNAEGAGALRIKLAELEASRAHWTAVVMHANAVAAGEGESYAKSLGKLFAAAGRYADAERWLRRALDQNSNDAGAHAYLGTVYGNQGRLEEGLACFDAALALQPDFPWAMSCHERMRTEHAFLAETRSLLAQYVGRRGSDPDPEAIEVEFPSVIKDSNDAPRFTLSVPGKLVARDLGAAHLFRQEVFGKGYEHVTRRFLDAFLRSDDVFVDVGAHWGIHALTAATRSRGEIDVLAVEAHPDNCARLARQVERNGLSGCVDVVSVGACDREGKGSLWINGSTMGHSLRDNARDVGLTSIEIPVTTLDALLGARPRLRWRRTVLKIDVEGLEFPVLQGARELFSTGTVAAVIWENGDSGDTAARRQRRNAIAGFLAGHGFENFSFSEANGAFRLNPLATLETPGDVISLPAHH